MARWGAAPYSLFTLQASFYTGGALHRQGHVGPIRRLLCLPKTMACRPYKVFLLPAKDKGLSALQRTSPALQKQGHVDPIRRHSCPPKTRVCRPYNAPPLPSKERARRQQAVSVSPTGKGMRLYFLPVRRRFALLNAAHSVNESLTHICNRPG